MPRTWRNSTDRQAVQGGSGGGRRGGRHSGRASDASGSGLGWKLPRFRREQAAMPRGFPGRTPRRGPPGPLNAESRCMPKAPESPSDILRDLHHRRPLDVLDMPGLATRTTKPRFASIVAWRNSRSVFSPPRPSEMTTAGKRSAGLSGTSRTPAPSTARARTSGRNMSSGTIEFGVGNRTTCMFVRGSQVHAWLRRRKLGDRGAILAS